MQAQSLDTGLTCLVMLARYLGFPVNGDELAHRMGKTGQAFAPDDIVRAARQLEFRARLVPTTWERLAVTPLPAIAAMRDGTFAILGGIKDDKAMVQTPGVPTPTMLTRDAFEAVWSGRIILLTTRSSLTDMNRRFGIGWFAPAIYKYRRLMGEVLVASFMLQILGLLSPIFFQVVIDKVLVHRGISTLEVLVVGLALVSLFETLLGGLRTHVFTHTTNRIDVELGARLFNHLLALPFAYFQARRVGDSVARVRELENVRSFLTGSALTLVIDLFFTLVFIAVMLIYSVWLTLLVLATLPIYVWISMAVTPLFKTRLDEKFRRGAENQAFLVESVNGMETVKAMAVEPQMQRRWEEQLAGYVQASFAVQSLANWSSQSVQFVNKLTTVLILFFGARAVMNDSLTVGELVAFNMLSGRVSAPVLRLAQLWQDFQQTRVSIDRLGDIFNTPREAGTQANRASLPDIRGEVRLEHVTFRYRADGPATLTDVSVEITPGQVVGIVGQSGSGKSTLAKLIQRLYVPESGRVLVDGVDLALADTSWLRRQIGVVLQENLLLNRSVRENIALAEPAMGMDRVIAAAKLAGAHEFILELPSAYDTEIGERGTSLSGGQRQRIAIARALVTNPRILILDEATSALDYESERVILANMAEIVRGRTVIVIAHRLSTIRRADRILTLDRGRLVEDGSHHDLLQRNGRYAQLFRLQEHA